MKVFSEVYKKNWNAVLGFLRRLCNNDALAEELAQEAFFRAFINFASCRNKDRPLTWLCQIARNCYFSWYKANKILRPLTEEKNVTERDVSDVVVEKETGEEVRRAIEGLDEPFRDVFILASEYGIPLKEISKRYGKSESWARVIYYRAKQMLREGLS